LTVDRSKNLQREFPTENMQKEKKYCYNLFSYNFLKSIKTIAMHYIH